MKQIIASWPIDNSQDLARAVAVTDANGVAARDNENDDSSLVIYVLVHGDGGSANLVQPERETLTDRSKVYNLHIQ
jgi:hypothetical protein